MKVRLHEYIGRGSSGVTLLGSTRVHFGPLTGFIDYTKFRPVQSGFLSDARRAWQSDRSVSMFLSHVWCLPGIILETIILKKVCVVTTPRAHAMSSEKYTGRGGLFLAFYR